MKAECKTSERSVMRLKNLLYALWQSISRDHRDSMGNGIHLANEIVSIFRNKEVSILI
jgi:hypothetical protein